MGNEVAEKTEEQIIEGQQQEQQSTEGKAQQQGAAAEGEQQQAQQAEGEEGFEVVEEGAPAGSDRGLMSVSAHIKAKQKWKARQREAVKSAEALTAENELLRMQLEQRNRADAGPKPLPKRENFADDAAHEAAMRGWVAEQVQVTAAETIRKTVPAQAQADVEQDDTALDAYYGRAAKLKAPDFEAAENEVITAIGRDAAQHIISLFDNSEVVMYALGKNPKKLAEIASDLKKTPVRAIKNLTEYASKLTLKPRGKAPQPDSASDARPTSSTTDPQKALERMREEVHANKRPMKDVIAFKEECRRKGISLN